MSEQKIKAILGLYEANSTLFQRVGELIQEGSERWHSQRRQAIVVTSEQADAQLRELLDTHDFPALVTLQTNIVRRHWQANEEAIQEAMRRRTGSPEAFLFGLMEAFSDWQRSVEKAMDDISQASAQGPWTEYLSLTTRFWHPKQHDTKKPG